MGIVPGQTHRVVVVQHPVEAGVMKGECHVLHVQVAVVYKDLRVFPFLDRTPHVAKMHVEDLALLPEVLDHLEHVLSRLTSGAHAESHAVVRAGNLGEQPVKVGGATEDVGISTAVVDGRVVPVHGDVHTGAFRHWDRLPVDVNEIGPDLVGSESQSRVVLHALEIVEIQ